MDNTINATKQHFETSSSRTPQYLAWHRLFKREFKKFLNARGIVEIDIHKPNHFDVAGFFKILNGQVYYFSISDLRWSKDSMLIRTAKDFKDYTGGSIGFISLDSLESFEQGFGHIVRH